MIKTRYEVHQYWRSPDSVNKTDNYLARGVGRSMFLLSNIRRLATHNDKILEIGCNAGRNLAFLWHGGFRRLHGVEISEQAVHKLRSSFPELGKIPIDVGPAEEILPRFDDNSFNIVFTMAVLEHIHDDSSALFDEMGRISRRVIVIEDEATRSDRHFPRNYRRVFQEVGMTQVEFLRNLPDLPSQFRYRVFDKVRNIPKARKGGLLLEWMPISTADRKAKFVLGTDGLVVVSIRWSDKAMAWKRADTLDIFAATHWTAHPPMPLTAREYDNANHLQS